MTKMMRTVFVHLLSIASIWRLFLSLPTSEQDRAIWLIGLALICVFLAAAIIWEIVVYVRSSQTRFRLFKERRIRAYMRRWLSSGGRAVVFTRDMTWADD